MKTGCLLLLAAALCASGSAFAADCKLLSKRVHINDFGTPNATTDSIVTVSISDNDEGIKHLPFIIGGGCAVEARWASQLPVTETRTAKDLTCDDHFRPDTGMGKTVDLTAYVIACPKPIP